MNSNKCVLHLQFFTLTHIETFTQHKLAGNLVISIAGKVLLFRKPKFRTHTPTHIFTQTHRYASVAEAVSLAYAKT